MLIEQILANPGDILFYRVTPKSNWKSRLIGIVQLIRGEGSGPTQYSHVSLVAEDRHYQYEAIWPKSRMSIIDWRADIEVWRVKGVDANHASRAVYWASNNLGRRYNIGQLLFGCFTLNNSYSCTQFVGKAYLFAGTDLLQALGRFVGPNELLETELLERIA